MIETEMGMDPKSLDIKRDGKHIGYVQWHKQPQIVLTEAYGYLTLAEVEQALAAYKHATRPRNKFLKATDRSNKQTAVHEFREIVTIDQVKPGDRIICPSTPGSLGLLSGGTGEPVLWYVVRTSPPFHLVINDFPNGKTGPQIAFDLCLQQVPPTTTTPTGK